MIDKKLFDSEYSTQWRDEVDFLKENGVNYTFVKRNDGISTYKYEKTSELFSKLTYFYAQKEK